MNARIAVLPMSDVGNFSRLIDSTHLREKWHIETTNHRNIELQFAPRGSSGTLALLTEETMTV